MAENDRSKSIKKRVGLIFGGRSGEHEVSIASALSVYAALDKTRYDVTMIAIDKVGRWFLPDPAKLLAHASDPMHAQVSSNSCAVALVPFSSSAQLVQADSGQTGAASAIPKMDVMIPILHGTYGEDGTIQGLLELSQIPYVGSGVLGSAVGMDKEVSRQLLAANGIPTVPTMSVLKFDYKENSDTWHEAILEKFEFPFFVKPANAGSSVGVHKVKSAAQLPTALQDAFDFDLKVLIEKGVAARELECAVLGNDNPRASSVGEIVVHTDFYDYDAKYINDQAVELQTPAKSLPAGIEKKIQDWSKLAFRVLQCRGMARVDFFLDKNTGELYLNEINTIPGFTKSSMYPRMWAASGLAYPDLLDELIRLAIENYDQRKALKTTYDSKKPAGR